MPLRPLLALVLALAACADGGPSTAGAFDDGAGGVSTAGAFDDPSASGDGWAAADLLAEIDRDSSPDRTLGYDRARDVLYAHDDAAGGVCGIYSGACIRLGRGDPSVEAFDRGVNAEHVWPQSMGAREEPLRSDLHHLFPERQEVNSSRGNLPIGEVPDAQAEAWYRDGTSRSSPPRADLAAWSERGAGRFEPRDAKKGDVARAVFYVVAVYPELVEPAYFRTMQADLLAWNRADPPDAAERARSAWIATLQGTENPFVRDPALADRIWSGSATQTAGSARPSTPPASTPRPTAPAGALTVSELHYDNAGEDVGEGVEVAGPPGAALDGWALALYNGSDGRVYQTVALQGAVPASGAAWTSVPGLQNGSPDGVALVAPDGSVAEFWSYEGRVTAVDGPARGQTATDLGVSQAPSTPRGTSLHRGGRGWAPGPATPGR